MLCLYSVANDDVLGALSKGTETTEDVATLSNPVKVGPLYSRQLAFWCYSNRSDGVISAAIQKGSPMIASLEFLAIQIL